MIEKGTADGTACLDSVSQSSILVITFCTFSRLARWVILRLDGNDCIITAAAVVTAAPAAPIPSPPLTDGCEFSCAGSDGNAGGTGPDSPP